MANENLRNGREREIANNNGERKSSVPNDLPDNPRDAKELEPEEIIMDLPDVKDIPGQEFIHVPGLGEMADTTISSDDEEGVNILGLNDEDSDEDDDTTGAMVNISSSERRTLADDNYMPTRDEENLQRARMDNFDFEGEPLNEGSFGELQTETDLDIPGSRDETEPGSLGHRDEENKGYSISDTEENQSSENRTGA